jgi:hypothetical protein
MDALTKLLDAQTRLSAHPVDGPELYALHPADHRFFVYRLDLAPDGRGGHGSRVDGLIVGPVLVPDHFVPRSMVQAWGSAAEYRKSYEAR